MNSFRQLYGLRWQRERMQLADIRAHLQMAAYIVGLLAVFGLVCTMDYADAQRSEAERQAVIAERATRHLAECLNGTLRLVSADGTTAVVCDRAYEISYSKF